MVSVIILNYNTFELTCRCIQSVFEKTDGIDFEVIVVDNASVECLPQLFKKQFPAIILVESSVNLGFAGGNNLGLKTAKGDYILLLNSDTELVNNAIAIAYQRMKNDAKIGALSTKLIYPDGRIQPTANRFPSLKTELRELLRLNKLLSPEQRIETFLGAQFDHQTERECDWIWGAFFMLKRQIINQFPQQKLHDNFFMYAEDVQWCFAIKRLGYKVLYYPEAVVIHYLAGSATATGSETERYHQKILPNNFKLLKIEKGVFYAYTFYFFKALHHITLRTKSDFQKAKYLLKFIFMRKQR